nr:hypothetical protein [uncultured Acetatifactor sp.]
MVLTKKEILERIDNSAKHKYPFIDPVDISNIQSASYDLTLGEEYYICAEKDIPDIKHLGANESLRVPPRATFFVISKEKLCIPNDLCASVSLAFGLIKKGIIFAVQPPIDPGYHGAIVALLHNMSDEEIVLEQGRHILNVVYYQLASQVSAADAYKGNYNDITLKKFCTEAVKHSAIVTLTNEAKDACDKALTASGKAETASTEAKNASHKTLSTIITIITVMLAVLTILMTAATVFLAVKAFQPSEDIQSTQVGQREEAVCDKLDERDSLLDSYNLARQLFDMEIR